jgi:hypothetical protein
MCYQLLSEFDLFMDDSKYIDGNDLKLIFYQNLDCEFKVLYLSNLDVSQC